MSRARLDRNASKLFTGYRALGYVSNHVPAIVRYHHQQDDMQIITSIGKSFNTYGSKLNLVESSLELPDDITCLDSDSNNVFAAAGPKIYCFKNGHGRWLIHTYSGHCSTIVAMLAFGPHVVSIDEESVLIIHEIRSETISTSMKLDFKATCMMHPMTYTNKVLVGSEEGSLELINLKSQDTIYRFKGWSSKVTVIEQCPAIDVVGIGLANGRILIHNLKLDETIMDLQQEWGKVRSLTFRTDGPTHMVSTSDVGHLAIWDLDKQRVVSQMRDIHSSSVEGATFVLSQPLLVTNSSDNSLKVWLFNDFDDSGRQLYIREGHKSPLTTIRFYDPCGYHILSSSRDGTIRNLSTLSQRLDRNLGSASSNRPLARKVGAKRDPNRMSHVITFAAEPTRKKDWDDVVAIHNNSNVVTTWSSDRCCMGHHQLVTEKGVNATSVCMTPCGNFAIIGYRNGSIHKFNVQSGIHRGSFKDGHECSVTGLTTDSLGQILLSAGQDTKVNFWLVKSGKLLDHQEMGSPVTRIRGLKESSLVAVALASFRVNVIDIYDRRKMARKFPSHLSPITDMTFSPDGRWLLVACEDASVRVWDLLKSRMIDHFVMPLPCRSLDMSPTSEFLATTHDSDVGVFLWTNMTLFAPISVTPLARDFQPQLLTFPRVKRDDTLDDVDEVDEDDEEEDDSTSGSRDRMETESTSGSAFKSPDQLRADLVTLSGQPSSRWKNLINIDLIKKRNKPKDPPKVLEVAPFFLPTISGLEGPTFPDVRDPHNESSRLPEVKESNVRGITSSFGQLLMTASYVDVLDTLKGFGPSRIDAEIRSLTDGLTFDTSIDVDDDALHSDSRPLLGYFLDVIKDGLSSKKDFELVVSYLALFLRIHNEVLLEDRRFQGKLDDILVLLNDSWSQRVEPKILSSQAIIGFLRTFVS